MTFKLLGRAAVAFALASGASLYGCASSGNGGATGGSNGNKGGSGSSGSGGTVESGGTNGSGGSTGRGGASGNAGTGGTNGSGGASGTGGSSTSTGGASGTGGSTGTGGSSTGSGGATDAGGSTGAGGSSTGSGGATGAGGTSATGSGGSTATGSYTWNNVAIGGGGFVTGIVFSPAQNGLAFARTDVGGFYRWNGTKSQWTPLTDGFWAAQGNYLGGESIAPDPTDAQIVYAAAGMYESNGNGVILRSTDQGNTWTTNTIGIPMGGNDLGRGMGERLAVDPNNHTILYFGSRGSGLYESTNSGSTWSKVTAFPTAGDVNIANSYGGNTSYGLPVVVFDKRGGTASGSTTIYVAAATNAAGSNLYHTTNGGTSWSEISGGPTGLMAHHATVGSDGTVWLAYGSNYGPYNTGSATLTGQVWKYLASGSWTNVTPANGFGGMAGGISVDAQNPMHVVVSTLDLYQPDRLLATTDGGATWTIVAQPPAYGNAGSTYDDNGAAYWYSGVTQIGTNATNWVEAVALDPFSSNHVMYGTGAGVWSSTDINAATTSGQGVTWTFTDNGLEETVPLYLVPSVNGAFLGAIGDLGGMRNAALDTYSTTGEYINPQQSNVNWIDFAESNPMIVVRVGKSGTALNDIGTSSDNGQTWKPIPTAPPGYVSNDSNSQSVAVSADGSKFIVAPGAGYGSPAVTSDGGTSWTTCAGLPSGAVVAADRVNASVFYATNSGALYVSTNSGTSFTSANTYAGNGVPRPVFGQTGEVWVAGNGSLFRFTGQGGTKTQISSITNVTGVGFGKAANGQSHPAVYAIGTVGSQYGFFRSDDGAGATWTRVNDDQHQFGSLQGNFIAGDETTYGRVYLTTGGRGYVYGDIKN